MTDRYVLYVDGGCSGNAQRDPARRVMTAIVTNTRGRVVSFTRCPSAAFRPRDEAAILARAAARPVFAYFNRAGKNRLTQVWSSSSCLAICRT